MVGVRIYGNSQSGGQEMPKELADKLKEVIITPEYVKELFSRAHEVLAIKTGDFSVENFKNIKLESTNEPDAVIAKYKKLNYETIIVWERPAGE